VCKRQVNVYVVVVAVVLFGSQRRILNFRASGNILKIVGILPSQISLGLNIRVNTTSH